MTDEGCRRELPATRCTDDGFVGMPGVASQTIPRLTEVNVLQRHLLMLSSLSRHQRRIGRGDKKILPEKVEPGRGSPSCSAHLALTPLRRHLVTGSRPAAPARSPNTAGRTPAGPQSPADHLRQSRRPRRRLRGDRRDHADPPDDPATAGAAPRRASGGASRRHEKSLPRTTERAPRSPTASSVGDALDSCNRHLVVPSADRLQGLPRDARTSPPNSRRPNRRRGWV